MNNQYNNQPYTNQMPHPQAYPQGNPYNTPQQVKNQQQQQQPEPATEQPQPGYWYPMDTQPAQAITPPQAPQPDPANFAVATFNAAEAAEELEGLGTISLDIIKIPAGGGVTFEIPTGDPENPDVAKEIEGIIVWHHAFNAFWSREFTGEDVNPDCVSLDGKQGKDMHTLQMQICANCPRNQFGSKGAGKACRNSHRLYILRQGDSLPLALNIPPTSLKPLKEYIAKRLICRNKKTAGVVTRITLKKVQSSTGIVYSQAVFSYVRDLTPQEISACAPMTALVKAIGVKYPEPEDHAFDPQPINAQPVNPQPAQQARPQARAMPSMIFPGTNQQGQQARQALQGSPYGNAKPQQAPAFVEAPEVDGDIPF